MKNAKNNKKTTKNKENSRKKGGFLWCLGAAAVAVVLLFSCQLFFENTITGKERFYANTKINGIDVSGMSIAEAENVVLTDMLEGKNELEVNLKSKDKTWTLYGNDFEVTNKIQPVIKEISRYGKDGNFFQNLKKEKEIKANGKDFTVSYTKVLGSMDSKLDEIIKEVERESVRASLVFQPNEEEVFKVDPGQNAVIVNRDKLYEDIDLALKNSKKVEIEIPIIEIENEIDLDELKNSVGLRSAFSTSYATSSADRKNNVKRALEAFNGLVVEPGQSVSFNETTGARTVENGYKSAHIIVGGVYVDGVGGGVCQASTTLYNALILADVDVLSVNHHSLPASYVPLSFDAMVSGSYSDLVFKNNFDFPLYIKTFSDSQKVGVEIYGQKLEDGKEIKTRSELVKILPHGGDRVVSDEKGEYSSKILYKGEYFRVKYPREGYESKGFVEYYQDGQLVGQKKIRHDFYQPQDGIVMEGVEEPAPSMSIPVSDVKIIKPQKVTKENEEAVRAKLEKTNPSKFNP